MFRFAQGAVWYTYSVKTIIVYWSFMFLGGEIVSTFGRPELVKLGECKVIEEVMIGEDKVSNLFDLDTSLSLIKNMCKHKPKDVHMCNKSKHKLT